MFGVHQTISLSVVGPQGDLAWPADFRHAADLFEEGNDEGIWEFTARPNLFTSLEASTGISLKPVIEIHTAPMAFLLRSCDGIRAKLSAVHATSISINVIAGWKSAGHGSGVDTGARSRTPNARC